MLSRKIGLSNILPLLTSKRVLLRADFNVPLQNTNILDNTRILETVPTIKRILEQRPSGLVLMSHLGRPDGKRQEKFSMRPIVKELESLLQRKVQFIDDCVSDEAVLRAQRIENQEVLLLENLRFHIEEEGQVKDESGKKIKGDPEKIKNFRQRLNSLGDIFVNDAFGTAHRAHSSMVGITCPIRAAGDLMKRELDYFSKALEQPQKPYLVVLGGAKIHDKIPLIDNLLEKVDEMIIGGGMAFTFLHIQGVKVGNSLIDKTAIPLAQEILAKAERKGVKIHLPKDFLCGQDLKSSEGKYFTEKTGIPDGMMGLDCGEITQKENEQIIRKAKTVVWNGPQGCFENAVFRSGSVSLVESLMRATNAGAVTIAGGGDTLNLLKLVRGSKEQLSHVSTGGGASLELLEGKILPGVEHLTDIDNLKMMI